MAEIEYLKWAVAFLLGGWGWYVKRLIDNLESANDALRGEIAEIKENYIRKEDFKEFKVEIKDMFNEIKQDLKELKR